MAGGGEPVDERVRERQHRVGRRVPAEPARGGVGRDEVLALDRVGECGRRSRRRLERGVRRRSIDSPDRSYLAATQSIAPDRLPVIGRDEPKQGSPGEELERHVEHERVRGTRFGIATVWRARSRRAARRRRCEPAGSVLGGDVVGIDAEAGGVGRAKFDGGHPKTST